MKKLFKAIAMRRKRKFRKDFLLALIAADHGRYGYHYLSMIAVILTEFADGATIHEVKKLCDAVHYGGFTEKEAAAVAELEARKENEKDQARQKAVNKLAGLDEYPTKDNSTSNGRAGRYYPASHSAK